MSRHSLYLRVLIAVATCNLEGQATSSISFLQELMKDTAKIATQEEALRQIEDIKSARDVKNLVPIAFEATNSRSSQAQLYGASALFSIATRPDGPLVLAGEADSIMRLLTHSEPRLKTTCVILTQTLKLSPSLYEQKFLQFLSNPAEPRQVKPGVIGALVRIESSIEHKKRAIGAFLKSEASDQIRLEGFNAVASSPTDQVWHADLVAIGLHDRNEHIRQYSITLLQRLGPNSLSRHIDEIRQIALNSTETLQVRETAQRALTER